MSFRRTVVSGLYWSAGGRLAGQAVSWIITIVVIRVLSPADYGLLAMATVFVEFFGMMSQFGAGTAVVQAPELDERKLRQMFGFAIVVNGVLFAVIFLGAPLVAAFFGEERLTVIVRALAVPFLLSALGMIPGALLARELHYKTMSLIALSATIVSSVTTLVLALAGAGVWSLVWGTLVSAAWVAVINNIASPFLKWPIFSFRGTRELVVYGGNLTITRILWFWYSQADTIIAGKLLGKELLGIYSVAMHLATLPANKLSALINQVAFPAFARIQHDRERYASHFLMAVRLLSFAVFPTLWGMSSVAPELVRVLLGEKWVAAIVPLQLLALIMPVHMFLPFMVTAANGIGRADVSTKQVLIASLVMPVAFAIGSVWGLVGIALAWVIAFPLVFAQSIRLFTPVLGLGARSILRSMAPSVVACAGMYLAVTAVRYLLAPQMGEYVQLVLLVLTGVAAYATLTVVFNRDGVKEVLGVFRG
ncbi:MAG TPA: lipopolysaccharide biosynthesis protein [Burkholderiales bacterium]|nr:lipopolysaccharide biosynthesis protein [Burkholderiales bacterium]